MRLEQHPGVVGEAAVPGQAAEQHTEIDATADRLSRRHPDRGKADISGVFERAGPSAAIEGDIELSRQAIELAVVQNMVVERSGQRPRIDQFLRVNTGKGAAGQVADIVGAGTAGS